MAYFANRQAPLRSAFCLLPVCCRLANPKRRDDAKVVGALVMKMLQYFEKQTGAPKACLVWSGLWVLDQAASVTR